MRLFFAIPLDNNIKHAINTFNTQNIFPLLSNIKKVAEENLHITLKFIGETNESALDLLNQKITQQMSKHNTFNMQIQGLGAFPSAQRAKVIWIGLKNNIDKITTIHNEINNLLNELKIPHENEKSFHPHITIGRFKESPPYNKVNKILVEYKDTSFGIININSITLYKSTLTPDKPIYTPLFNFKFNSH